MTFVKNLPGCHLMSWRHICCNDWHHWCHFWVNFLSIGDVYDHLVFSILIEKNQDSKKCISIKQVTLIWHSEKMLQTLFVCLLSCGQSKSVKNNLWHESNDQCSEIFREIIFEFFLNDFSEFSESRQNLKVVWLPETLKKRYIPTSSGKKDISVTVSGKVSIHSGSSQWISNQVVLKWDL